VVGGRDSGFNMGGCRSVVSRGRGVLRRGLLGSGGGVIAVIPVIASTASTASTTATIGERP
jgi:hypothetical protein